MNNFTVIAVFTYAHEYAILKLILEQHHIRFYFQNETMISVLPFHSNAFGGIRLLVHPDDVEQAKQILSDLNNPPNLRIV